MIVILYMHTCVHPSTHCHWAICYLNWYNNHTGSAINRTTLSVHAEPSSAAVLVVSRQHHNDTANSIQLIASIVTSAIKSSYCIRALVFRVGSSGRKFRYSSTSFSMASSCDCSLLRRLGKVLRMWFVSCWLRVRCRYGVPIRSTKCLHTHSQFITN